MIKKSLIILFLLLLILKFKSKSIEKFEMTESLSNDEINNKLNVLYEKINNLSIITKDDIKIALDKEINSNIENNFNDNLKKIRNIGSITKAILNSKNLVVPNNLNVHGNVTVSSLGSCYLQDEYNKKLAELNSILGQIDEQNDIIDKRLTYSKNAMNFYQKYNLLGHIENATALNNECTTKTPCGPPGSNTTRETFGIGGKQNQFCFINYTNGRIAVIFNKFRSGKSNNFFIPEQMTWGLLEIKKENLTEDEKTSGKVNPYNHLTSCMKSLGNLWYQQNKNTVTESGIKYTRVVCPEENLLLKSVDRISNISNTEKNNLINWENKTVTYGNDGIFQSVVKKKNSIILYSDLIDENSDSYFSIFMPGFDEVKWATINFFVKPNNILFLGVFTLENLKAGENTWFDFS